MIEEEKSEKKGRETEGKEAGRKLTSHRETKWRVIQTEMGEKRKGGGGVRDKIEITPNNFSTNSKYTIFSAILISKHL